MKKNHITLLFIFLITALHGQTKYPTIVISTNYGDMKAILYDDTPNHSAHFLKLVKQGYFDGTLFHRVLQNMMIQGGGQDSRNAPPGAQVGGGRTDMEIMPEFREHYFHKKGALAVPRRNTDVNPQKKSDASQFYIVHGRVYSQGRLDSMEIRVNTPIKNKIIREHYVPYREELDELKTGNPTEFNNLLDSLLHVVDSLYEEAPGKYFLREDLKEAYSTIGGSHHLDNEYTIFGEVIEGFEVIDKIANLEVDSYNRPFKDAVMLRVYTE